MNADVRQGRAWVAVLALFLLASMPAPSGAEAGARASKTIAAVLREPLPPETLTFSTNGGEWIITGPTFTYRVQKSTGAIVGLRVESAGQEAIVTSGPADIQIDDYRLVSELTSCELEVLSALGDKVVLRGQGTLRDAASRGPKVDYTLLHTFFDDGVVVSSVKLRPHKDLPVRKELVHQLQASGRFSHYLHKRRDEHGAQAVRGRLPELGQAVPFSTLTSCLQVFSPDAGLALFTDGGAIHLSRTNLDTAAVQVMGKEENRKQVSLRQYLVHVEPGDDPFVLKAGEEFSFRVGLSVTPNRITHRRLHDLRMFAWIGDSNYPYATDQEIEEVARAGYTLFQMHRLGTPGEPRPPAGELERVIQKVHEVGMLFLWTANADLMYESAPGVQGMKVEGKWHLWRGFNYNGHYKASMDPYCDLAATCLASPNGLAEYRLATIDRMLQRFKVDGMYIDDNLAYPNCTLWREHGHPRQVYDCLIELHEMNWRRRQRLRSVCPHLVLVSHNTQALVLPVVCDFDAVLYGEGYSFESLENYWEYYRPANAIPAQGMIWPGGQDPVRCPAALAYNYDLLTGGGQYCHIDWRFFPKKFPHGAGVTDVEQLYVRTYNLAQYYFGLYESTPYYFANSAQLFATSTPRTQATIYRNRVWNDWLIPVANMGREPTNTSLQFRAPEALGLDAQRNYSILDTVHRRGRNAKGSELNQALAAISIPGHSLQLFSVRQLPTRGVYHAWGGKRMAEEWDPVAQKLTVMLLGPVGLRETVLFGTAGPVIRQVKVAGQTAPFSFDAEQELVHGTVMFAAQPIRIEVLGAGDGADGLPEAKIPSAPLADIVDRWD